MEWLLTEEEMNKAEKEAKLYYGKYHPFATGDYHASVVAMRRAVAKAQARKLLDWLKRASSHEHSERSGTSGELVINGVTVGLLIEKDSWNALVEEVCFAQGRDIEWDAKEPV
jgi:hypothetical protein